MAEMEFNTTELVEAQTQVWNILVSYLKSMCLKCTLELGIADALKNHGKPMELSELTSALSIPPSKFEPFSRFMTVLVHLQLFAEKRDDSGATKYTLTPASHLLVKDETMNITHFLSLILDPIICDSSHVFGPWFKSPKDTPFEFCFGKGFWDVTGEKEFNKMFNEGMASDSKFISDVVMMNCKDVFEGLESIVDVGGGTGTMARAIVHALPGIKCIVLDLPHVIDTLEDQDDAGVEYVGGDMFVSIPRANAVLLKWILPSWNNEECIKILQRCKEAIPSKADGGKIIIIDIVMGATKSKHACAIETQLLFDLLLMSVVPGRERTECEWQKLFLYAGFKDYKITHFLGLRSIIELYP